jgi:hypothetical protein
MPDAESGLTAGVRPRPRCNSNVYSAGDQECEACEQNARGKTPARNYVRTAPAPPQPNFAMSQTVHSLPQAARMSLEWPALALQERGRRLVRPNGGS